jgi:hypothetical protein
MGFRRWFTMDERAASAVPASSRPDLLQQAWTAAPLSVELREEPFGDARFGALCLADGP